MNPNEIHDEIRRTRDALVRECGGDLKRFGDLRRAGEARWAAAGHPVVSFVGEPLRELPPGVPPYRGDGEDNEILREIRAARAEHARECGYDVHVMAEAARQREARLAEQGWKLVTLTDDAAQKETCVVREEPPKP